ncbi:hypothetical protein Clacol_005614 [Clathrus columnatus]|uniref:Coiled-coil domain-containing protein 137 n=1 Tax=Clathrus columnatus TaxID=1419009 RepID=A0AAV5ACQ8_9AGAM|nr:hypothetical protein Clacol_005614 [Clathrus columnatus]
MPHKRAKFSVRKENAKNSDLPPTGNLTLSEENVPKKIMRVLQAEQIRKTYREKRAREDDKNESGNLSRDAKRRKKEDDDSKPLVIKHGESLKKFNRRVEDEMRGQVAEAMQASRSITKKANKLEKKAKEDRIAAAQGKSKPKKTDDSKIDTPPTTETETKPTKPLPEMDFAKAEQRKRLNDIVQEPPTFTKLPRGVKSTTNEGTKTEVVLPMMQKRMEIERERAIKRYRELKEKQLAEKKT